MNYYLAVDIGASSGRHILCHIENGRLVTEEIYRFPNGALPNENGVLCWNVRQLFFEIICGMKKCRESGKIPVSMGIDTWGVDFVLTDASGNIIGDSVSYRDKRTDTVSASISDSELYSKTGIQKQKFNTVYQLAYLKNNFPEQLENAAHMLMLPDYFNFLLTGNIMQEYTNATTTGLVNAENCDWDIDIIKALGIPEKIFSEIRMPCALVGGLKAEISAEVGFDTNMILTASHDTASAVMAAPSNRDDVIHISSGTWSLEERIKNFAYECKRRPIKAGDVNAADKFRAKVEELTALQNQMKQANAEARRRGESALHAAWELSNNRQNLKRYADRLEALERAKAVPTEQTEEIGGEGFRIVRNTDIMRLQFLFDGKPDKQTRTLLKSNGFKWAPSQMAWQRQLTANAERAARTVAKAIQ